MAVINIDALIKKLKSPGLTLIEKKDIIRKLGLSKEKRAVDHLIEFIDDPSLEKDVIRSLANLILEEKRVYEILSRKYFKANLDIRKEILNIFQNFFPLENSADITKYYLFETDEELKKQLFLLAFRYQTERELKDLAIKVLDDGTKELKIHALRYLQSFIKEGYVFEKIFNLIGDIDADVAEFALKIIKSSSDKNLFEKFIEKINNSRGEEKIRLIRGLGLLDDKRVIAVLAKVLVTKNVKLRKAALEAIARNPDKRVENLLVKLFKILTLEEVEVVSQIALKIRSKLLLDKILNYLANIDGIKDKIISVLEKSEFVFESIKEKIDNIKKLPLNIRYLILRLIENFDCEKADKVLLELLDEFVKFSLQEKKQIIFLIGKYNVNVQEKLLEIFNEQEDEVKIVILLVAKNLKWILFKPLVEELITSYPNEKVRASAVNVLFSIGDEKSYSTLLQALKDSDARVRANAVEVLEYMAKEGKINSNEVLNMLLPLLKDKNNRVKANVAVALWNLGGVGILRVLEEMLQNKDDTWYRASAAFALGETRSILAVNILASVINDPQEAVRRNVAKALGKIGDITCLSLLKKLVEDVSYSVVEEAIKAIANIKAPEAFAFLVELAIRSDYTFQELAIDCAVENAQEYYITPDYIKDILDKNPVLGLKLMLKFPNKDYITYAYQFENNDNMHIRNLALQLKEKLESIKEEEK